MAITLFGVATNPADSANALGPTIDITPVASMLDGDLVVVSVRYRASTATLTVAEAGGQSWSQVGAQYNATNIRAALFWCRFNGTWSANPSFTVTTGALNIDAQMLVFRPTSAAYTWTLESGPNAATYTAPLTPFTVTRAGRDTTAASTVTIAAFHSVDDNSWGALAGSGWSKTGLGAQYRNVGPTTAPDNSSSFAYNIQTSPATLPSVLQDQTALGGDAGSTSLTTFAETLVEPALVGQFSTSSAAPINRSFTEAALLGMQAAAAVGTALGVTEQGNNTNAPTDGAAAAGGLGDLLSLIGTEVESVGIVSAVGAVVVEVATAITSVAATALLGAIQVQVYTAGPSIEIEVGGTASAAQSQPLATSIPVVGIQGVNTTTNAGATTVQVNIRNDTALPGDVWATAAVGQLGVAADRSPASVEGSAVAETMLGAATVAEIDSGLITGSIGLVTPYAAASTPIASVSASAALGVLVTPHTAVIPIAGAAAAAALGTTLPVTPTFAIHEAGGVQSVAAYGLIQPSWTMIVPSVGVAATPLAGDVMVEAGDSIPDEVYPVGVAAYAVLGTLSVGEARVSPAGVFAQASAGAVTGLSAILIGALTADGVFVEPMFDGEVVVEPELSGEAFMEPLT